MATASPTAPLDDQIRNTTANVAVLLVKVHNLQCDMQSLTKKFDILAQQIIRLLHDPQAVNHDTAQQKDTRSKIYE